MKTSVRCSSTKRKNCTTKLFWWPDMAFMITTSQFNWHIDTPHRNKYHMAIANKKQCTFTGCKRYRKIFHSDAPWSTEVPENGTHQCNNLYLQPTTNQYRYSYATRFKTPVYHAGKHQQASKKALAHRFVHEVHSSCAHWLQCTAVDCSDGIRIQSSCSQTRRKLPAISIVKPKQITFSKFNWHPEQKFDAFIWTWIRFQNNDNTVLRDYFWDCISFSSVSIAFFSHNINSFPQLLSDFMLF